MCSIASLKRSLLLFVLGVLGLSGGIVAAKENAPGGLSMLVQLDGYESETEGLQDVEILKKAMSEVQPFAKYQAAIGFHVIPFEAAPLCQKKLQAGNWILECDRSLID